MILIKHIEYMQVKGNSYTILAQPFPYQVIDVNTDKGAELVEAGEIRELIKGRRLIDHKGDEVYIGMSNQAADLLGLQYEVFENLKRENDDYYLKLLIAKGELNELKSANLLTRLKWLFTGVG